MRCVVVGAGAWGLPAAAELAVRGHDVTLVDRHGPANDLSSSPGPTRLWRLAHPDRLRVRLAVRARAAMERLSAVAGRSVALRRGVLWRDDDGTVSSVVAALSDEGVDHLRVEPDGVGSFLAGLRPDGRPAVWQPEAGPVLAAVSLGVQLERFRAAGGRVEVGPTVVGVDVHSGGVTVRGSAGQRWSADRVLLAPGPGAAALLAACGVEMPLSPRLEQVVHLGDPARPGRSDDMACLVDGPHGDEPAMYAMPTPGVGYKVGLDRALRPFVDGDPDRRPDPRLAEQAAARIRRDLPSVAPVVLDAQVCCWTESPDNRFVIDVLDGPATHGSGRGGVVVACGDAGEGFKFSALMGEVLADLVEGSAPDPDVASFGLDRFASGFPSTPHVLGR